MRIAHPALRSPFASQLLLPGPSMAQPKSGLVALSHAFQAVSVGSDAIVYRSPCGRNFVAEGIMMHRPFCNKVNLLGPSVTQGGSGMSMM